MQLRRALLPVLAALLASVLPQGLRAAPADPHEPEAGPKPAVVRRSVACPGEASSWIVPFASAPFPYEGDFPGKGPFFDRNEAGRRGRTSPRGGLYWEDKTYSDSRVLLSVPKRFDRARPAAIVVYMHGNLGTLERDACRTQRIPAQVAASRLNAVLVAPQFARNALDSSAGRFWQPDVFRDFLAEAAGHLSALTGRQGFEAMPVVIVAYSGGYLPAISVAEVGGIGGRLKAIVLMDALFGEVERYADLIAGGAAPAFVSAYSGAARDPNAELRRRLQERGILFREGLPSAVTAKSVAFIATKPPVTHSEFMTKAFAASPLRVLLDRVGPLDR